MTRSPALSTVTVDGEGWTDSLNSPEVDEAVHTMERSTEPTAFATDSNVTEPPWGIVNTPAVIFKMPLGSAQVTVTTSVVNVGTPLREKTMLVTLPWYWFATYEVI